VEVFLSASTRGYTLIGIVFVAGMLSQSVSEIRGGSSSHSNVRGSVNMFLTICLPNLLNSTDRTFPIKRKVNTLSGNTLALTFRKVGNSCAITLEQVFTVVQNVKMVDKVDCKGF
jgi:hypothetical protein